MSIANIGSFTAGVDLYNFTDLTSRQAISAAGQLANEGIITDDQFSIIAGETPALSTVPINGYQVGSPDPLNSDVKSNFLQLTEANISSLESYAGSDPAVGKTLGLYESLLPVLDKLQNQYDSSVGSQTAGTLVDAHG